MMGNQFHALAGYHGDHTAAYLETQARDTCMHTCANRKGSNERSLSSIAEPPPLVSLTEDQERVKRVLMKRKPREGDTTER